MAAPILVCSTSVWLCNGSRTILISCARILTKSRFEASQLVRTLHSSEPSDGIKGQATYDRVVAEAGCANASDTLDCLRFLEYGVFLKATTDNFTGAFS